MDIKVQCKEARELLRDANKQEKVALSLRWPEEVMRENESLRDLVSHCWVHSGYENCGYEKMTTKQKELYDDVIREG